MTGKLRYCILALLVASTLMVWGAGAAEVNAATDERIADPHIPGMEESVIYTGPSILMYIDDAFFPWGQTQVENATVRLGYMYTAYYADDTGFITALNSQDWDLVIVSNPNWGWYASFWDPIDAYYTSGGRVIVVSWTMTNGCSIWDSLGADAVAYIYDPIPVYSWDTTHPIWDGVPNLTSPFNPGYGTNGFYTNWTNGSIPLGGFATTETADEAAIIITPDNRGITNAFLLEDYQADNDMDGIPDPEELWANEIEFILNYVDFSAMPTYGTAPLTVAFTDESSGASSWFWEFGDGTTSTLQNPIHTYSLAGMYTVRLTVGATTVEKANYIVAALPPNPGSGSYTSDKELETPEPTEAPTTTPEEVPPATAAPTTVPTTEPVTVAPTTVPTTEATEAPTTTQSPLVYAPVMGLGAALLLVRKRQ